MAAFSPRMIMLIIRGGAPDPTQYVTYDRSRGPAEPGDARDLPARAPP